jgi:hypothetical protein
MRNLWDDDQLHHQFRLVGRENGRLLEESIEIHISTRMQPYALELLQSEDQLNKSV